MAGGRWSVSDDDGHPARDNVATAQEHQKKERTDTRKCRRFIHSCTTISAESINAHVVIERAKREPIRDQETSDR